MGKKNDCNINIFHINDILTKNTYLIDDCVTAFTELLINSTHMMSQRIVFDKNKPTVKNAWFDKECLTKNLLLGNTYVSTRAHVH